VRPSNLDPDLTRKIRASFLLAGPMTVRSGELHLPPPGGDVIGRRRVDTHLLALRKLGARVDYDRSFHFYANHLTGADILLDEASVTATENAIMAATLAKGIPSSAMPPLSRMCRSCVTSSIRWAHKSTTSAPTH
jgi:UDP-N-acetylglucosamine 1-carboxyvinyltransferase